MTIDQIINLLKQSGVNSKKQVIEMLENANENELIELSKDCERRVVRKKIELH